MKIKLLLLLLLANFSVYAQQYTLIPDANFEKKLIELGIDSGTPDGNVLSSSIESVTELNLYYSNISDLTGIQGFKALTSLNVMSNKLSTVDLSKNLALNYLSISYNNLTTLDISHNTVLENLTVTNNKIQNIDVSNNLKLKYFACSSNQLTTIDVSNNKELVSLNCQLNQLKSLDLSQNKLLSLLTCSENNLLTNVNLRNGNNRNMQIAPYAIDFTKNPLLTCILVDNPIYSNEKWTSFKEKSASYSTVDCSQITAIPDPAFEDKLIYLQIDKDGKNGTILNTSISNITALNVENSNIKNLTGINGFSNLSTLNCSSNLLNALDLSQNKALTFINCGSNNLTSLNLKNGNNKNLDLNSSFTKNPDLTCITVDDEFYSNQKWANIKDDAANYNLDCTLYAIIDSNFEKKLIELGIDKDGVNGKISVENLEKITSLNLSNSNITDLKGIENFTGLTYLDCSGNNITTIDVSKNLNLTKLDLNSNQLTSLDVTKNTKLLNLSFAYNEVSTINLANNKELLFLNTSKNLLTNLDLTSNTALSLIDCSRNNLTQLNVSNAPELTYLIIDLNKITALDLSFNTKLTDLYCSNNELTSLDLSYNILLKRLSASWNQLTTLDLSHNPLLELVFVEFNPLNSLNIQNGNNKNFVLPSVSGKMADDTIIYTSFLGNAKLNCIQVDDENYSNANWSSIKESTTTYSNTCKSLGIDKSEFSQVVLYPNPTKGEITINNIALDKATVYNSLGQLVKSFTLNNVNTNNTIDLSGLPRGVYYVYLINGDAASAKKVIVE
ncbi:leucine-rich repeat domain-containing protein [Flavobacterium sp. GN10]|uniref:Leucine-rich repeat domain-containing protein n=1 Tax=Flavobacterium tagetis TaxID=2801336 RepID=A0ABS1KD46_9FLAO|nr:leucine-rich repeat domain-containing protein [Flavobacterium tagetis]MBL0736071.1 leucine-rich repeat domain-containing protein [Flavobacterium tagetis]